MMTAAILLAQSDQAAVQLTAAGAVTMVLSVTLVCGLNVFCMYRILREPQPSERHHAPLDIDVRDEE